MTLPDPPANTRIQLAATGDSVSIAVPPTGIKGPWGVMIFIGIIFTAASVFIGAGMVAEVLQNRFGGALFPLVGLAPFFIVGIFLALTGIQVARRRSVLLLTSDSLVFSQIGPLRRSETSWQRADIQDVRIGFSGVTVNSRPLMQVQIISHSGHKLRILTGWSDNELTWICQTLRQALHLDPPPAITPEESN